MYYIFWVKFGLSLYQVFSGVAESESPCLPENEEVVQSINIGDNTIPYNNLKVISKEIKAACGNICVTNQTGVPGKYYNAIWKDFDCNALFSHSLFDR